MVKRAHLSILLVATLLCASCSTFDSWMGSRQSATDQTLSVDDGALSLYLAPVETLLTGDAQVQARVINELMLDYHRAATTTNSLRLALALAAPNHAGSDLARADAMLTQLLQQPERLLADERLLASVELGLLRERITARSEAREAGNKQTRSAEQELAALRASMTLLQKDYTRLRDELAQTQEKLRAIILIERSIRERDDEAQGDARNTAKTTND